MKLKLTDKIFFVCLMIILVMMVFFNNCILDELWVFMNSCKVSQSITNMYTEANIITTPFSYIIISIILKIFGKRLINLRLIGLIYKIILGITTFKLFEKYISNKRVSFIFSNVIIFCFSGVFGISLLFIIIRNTYLFKLEK